MANLVDLYNKNNVRRKLKWIQEEVENACQGFIGQPANERTMRELTERMMEQFMRASMVPESFLVQVLEPETAQFQAMVNMITPDRPDRNGNIYTRGALERSMRNPIPVRIENPEQFLREFGEPLRVNERYGTGIINADVLTTLEIPVERVMSPLFGMMPEATMRPGSDEDEFSGDIFTE